MNPAEDRAWCYIYAEVFFVLNNKHQTIRQGKTSRNLIKSEQLFFIVKIKQMTSLFWNVVHNKLKIY